MRNSWWACNYPYGSPTGQTLGSIRAKPNSTEKKDMQLAIRLRGDIRA